MQNNTFSPLKNKQSADINPNGAIQMQGDAMARAKGKDMQAYSKAAHYQLGGAGEKAVLASTQSMHYRPEKPVENYHQKQQALKGNIQNMRGNHFDIANKRQDTVFSLSAAQLTKPAAAQQIGKIDNFDMKAKKAELGKEHWGHGVTEVPKYNSVTSVSFNSPAPNAHKAQNAKEVAELKARIGNHNFSYGNNALTKEEHIANYNSSTAVAHKMLGSANIDKKMITDQRIKLTKSNFQVGGSPLAFGTTAAETHTNLQFSPNNPAARNAMRDANSRTNFISHDNNGHFEKQIPPRALGVQPDKTNLSFADQKKMDGLMNDLKASHFKVGGEDGFRGTTNISYGQGHAAHSRTESFIKKGAGQHTNFIIGSDNQPKESETKARYNSQQPQINLKQREEIKQRMVKDSVTIGGSNNNFSTATTSANFFYDKDSANRQQNTNLQYKFMPEVNALKSSYPQMEGKFQGQSEQKSKFNGMSPASGDRTGMNPDRVAFMKDAHFDFANRAKPIGNQTMNKGMFPSHGQQPRDDPKQNNAYRLRTQPLDLAGKNQPTSYVTTNSLKVKWIQPSNPGNNARV